jgi:hypothetical protein
MLISATAATEAAKRGLQDVRLENNPGAAAARTAGNAGVPLLVTRLDTPKGDYYLVPWQDKRGIVLVVQVDAWSGVMSGAAVLSTPLPRLVMSPDEARQAVAARLSQRVIGEPQLVWRPCRESASPFQPLYQVPVAGGEAFVSVDGAVYRSLTPFGKGG